MICCLCFLFTLLLSGFGIMAVMLCIFSGIACNFFPLLESTIEILFAVLCFGSEVMIYIISGLIEVTNALMELCIYAAPFISRGCRHLYNASPYFLNEAQHQFWNFLNNQKEIFIFCWSLLLVALYMLKNQVKGIFRGDRMNNQNADINRQNIQDIDDDDDVNDDDSDIDDGNWRNQQRLYPVLPLDDSGDDDSDDDNNQIDDSQCIVCFEHDRNTAVFPCGHTHLCEQCTRDIMTMNNLCPVCQTLIMEYRKIYL